MKYSISIILPILNEINSLKKTLQILNKIQVDKEFIVIYSNKLTQDSVKVEIHSLKKKYKNLKCLKQIRPFVGGAIDIGIRNTKKNYIALMASDMETNPYELKSMINVSSKNTNSIISADRWISNKGFSDYGLIKFLANFFFQKLLKIFFNYKILDFTFAYRIYPKNALKNHRIKELRHGFALETLLAPMKKGFNVITLPAKWKKRVEGSSSITIKAYLSYLKVFFRFL
ncbi:glycosyltransferase [Candidatus Pelagibacter sp.]|nr:glycosyltransferase [Candidatus Pelagibacter sp.]